MVDKKRGLNSNSQKPEQKYYNVKSRFETKTNGCFAKAKRTFSKSALARERPVCSYGRTVINLNNYSLRSCSQTRVYALAPPTWDEHRRDWLSFALRFTCCALRRDACCMYTLNATRVYVC